MKWLPQITLAVTLLGGARDAQAAFDAFLQIEGIPGESSADSHKEWIELLSFSTAFQPGGGGAREATSSLELTKLMDKASPVLGERCAAGTAAPSARLELMESTPSAIRFFDIRLSNVVVSAYSIKTSCPTSSPAPSESLSLNYSKITWTYTVRRPNSRLPQELRSADWDFASQSGGGGTNAAAFTMTGIQRSGTEAVLSWTGVTGRTYDIYACPNLSGPFSHHAQVIATVSGPMSYSAPILPGSMFYVVEERL